MNIIYWILGFPHIIVYLFFRHKINEINEDLATYTSGKTGIKALIYSLRRNEYRNVLYYRLPLIIRKLLNITLPRVPDCKIQCSSIGGGMNVHHGWATIVLADKIGHNFSVYQNVTVGYGKDGKPTIGNNVTIYTGAVVVGKIKIGIMYVLLQTQLSDMTFLIIALFMVTPLQFYQIFVKQKRPDDK